MANVFEFVENLLDYVSCSCLKLTLIGGFNININSSNQSSTKLMEIVECYGFLNVVDIPTRVTIETATTR